MRRFIRVLRGRQPSVPRPDRTSRISRITGVVRAFTYEEMKQATDNFSDEAQVGKGGYGKVYLGILVDDTVVAIKRAQKGSLQGEGEFLTEIRLLSRLHHRNLVSLIGYCAEEGEQMLVYEFIPNGTLKEHLSEGRLSFPLRVRIALGSAEGIKYLHRDAKQPVFHRDVKPSNILLDLDYTAKVADFGISKLAPPQGIQGAEATHVSTMPKGTLGYMDPEYYLTGRLTDKSDVYSLGVVFLELLTGNEAISDGENIVTKVEEACRSGLTPSVIRSVIDNRLRFYSPPERITKFLELSLQCCQRSPHARPNIAAVVRELENIWSVMPESVAWSTESTSFDSSPSSDYGFSVEQQPSP